MKNALSQLMQPNLNNVLLSLKEILAYLSNDMSIIWLAKNSSLLFCGINYQLKKFANSDILTDPNYDDHMIETDPEYQIAEYLVDVIDRTFSQEVILINTPVFDIKDTICHILKIFQKEVTPKYNGIQDALHKCVANNIFKNERTFLYAVAASVCLFKEYCLESADVLDEHMQRTLRRLLVRINSMSRSGAKKNHDETTESASSNSTRERSQIHVTKHGQEACLKELDNFYTRIPDPKLIEKCYKNEQFKIVGTIYYLLIEGNLNFWRTALETGQVRTLGAQKQISKFIRGAEKKFAQNKTDENDTWMSSANTEEPTILERSQNTGPPDETESTTSSRNTSKDFELVEILAKIIKEITNKDTTEIGLEKLYEFQSQHASKFNLSEQLEEQLGKNSPLKNFIDYNLQRIHTEKSMKNSKLANHFINHQITSQKFKEVLKINLKSDPKQNLINFGHNHNINWSQYNSLPFDADKMVEFPKVALNSDGNLGEKEIDLLYDYFKTIGSRLEKCYENIHKLGTQNGVSKKPETANPEGEGLAVLSNPSYQKIVDNLNSDVIESFFTDHLGNPLDKATYHRLLAAGDSIELPREKNSPRNKENLNNFMVNSSSEPHSFNKILNEKQYDNNRFSLDGNSPEDVKQKRMKLDELRKKYQQMNQSSKINANSGDSGASNWAFGDFKGLVLGNFLTFFIKFGL